MRLSPDRMIEGLGNIVDRPVPRALLALTIAGTLEGGIVGGHAAFDESLTEKLADIGACTRALDPEAEQVREGELPDACESFRTSFSYRDTTVTVVNRGGDVESSPTSYRRTFYLPSAADFRRQQTEAARQQAKDESSSAEFLVGTGVGMSGVFFGVFSMIAGDRRRARRKAQKSAAAAA